MHGLTGRWTHVTAVLPRRAVARMALVWEAGIMRNLLAAGPGRERVPTLARAPEFPHRIADTGVGRGGGRLTPATAAADRRTVTPAVGGIIPASPLDDSSPAVRNSGFVGSRAAENAAETGG